MGPEKPPGCVPGGGRGSSSPAGNRAGAKRRRAHAVVQTARNGSVEGHLLAEGALGRRSRHSSRGGGGGGLGLSGHSVFTPGSGEVTRASERGVPQARDGEEPACVRGDAERSGPRGVNSPILRRGPRAELQAEPGCSSLRCGLQKPARRICGVQLRPSGPVARPSEAGAAVFLDGKAAGDAARKGARYLRAALRPGEACRSGISVPDSEHGERRFGP